MFAISRIQQHRLILAMLCLTGWLQLGGCANGFMPEQAPLLSLSPATLGQDLAVFQRVVIDSHGQSKAFDAALEVDASGIRLAVFQFGQTMARITWDGHQLNQTLAPGWPKAIAAESILSDLQYVWWPAHQIQAVLPTHWFLKDSANQRVLRHGSRLVLEAKLISPHAIELNNHANGYTVHIETETQNPQPSFSIYP